MQWSQIKTLFILSFLVLNIYLLLQLLDKQRESDLSVLEQTELTTEEILESENISIPQLPDGDIKERFISARQFAFTDDILEDVHANHEQQIEIVNRHLIVSILDDPISVPTELDDQAIDYIEMVMKDLVVFPEEYMFWDWNEKWNALIFFQKKDDRPVYYNQSGMILMFLNDDQEISFYMQTMLGEADTNQEKKSLIKPLKAIDTLYHANELYLGDDITEIDIGFHTRIPLTNGVQVFVPVWKITVNDNRSYFVNAIEGHVFSSNENEFLKEIIALDIERLNENEEDIEIKDTLLKQLNKRLDVILEES